jgi:hypothetical protein
MEDKDLKPLLDATEIVGRAKAKQDLLNRISDLHRPLDIVTEVMLWIGESDVDEAKKAD